MTIWRIPLQIDSEQLNPTEQFMLEAAYAIRVGSSPHDTSIVRFLSIIREYFADGCALLMNDETGRTQNWAGDSQLTDWFEREVTNAKREGRKGEPFAGYDTNQQVSYLAMPMSSNPDSPLMTYMILWRVGRLFYSEDVVAIKVSTSVYQGRFAPICHQASIPGRTGWDEGTFEGTMQQQRLSDALDVVHEVVIICGERGQIQWYNKAARQCLLCAKVAVMNFQDLAWLAHVVHLNDVQTVMPQFYTALALQKSTEVIARLPVNRCTLVPTTMCGGVLRNWVFLARKADEAALPCGGSSEDGPLGDRLRALLEAMESLLSAVPEEGASKADLDKMAAQVGLLREEISGAERRRPLDETSILPSYSKVCIEEIIDRAVKANADELIERDIEVTVDVCPFLPRFFCTDEARFQQIVEKLIAKSFRARRNSNVAMLVTKKTQSSGPTINIGITISGARSTADPSEDSVDMIVLERLTKLLCGTVSREEGDEDSLAITVALPYSDDPTPARSDYETRQMSLHSITSYIRSLRSSRPINIYSCSGHQALRSHYTRIFKRVTGVNVVEAVLGDLKLSRHSINVLIVDTLAGSTATWAALQDPEALNRSRFVLLKNSATEFNTGRLAHTHVPRPLVDTAVMRAVHEAIIRMSLAIVGAPANIPGSFPRSATARDLASSCPMRIMVVEDSMMNLQVLVKTLGKLGYKDVVEAHDGQEGVDLLIQEYGSDDPVELIFMDMQMPVLDGCGASMKIREYAKAHPAAGRKNGPHIVAMTANSFTEDRRACLRSGMCCFAGKPVRWELLEQLLIEGYLALHGQHVCRCQHKTLLAW